MPEFYMIFAQKYFPIFFRGGEGFPVSSYAYGPLCRAYCLIRICKADGECRECTVNKHNLSHPIYGDPVWRHHSSTWQTTTARHQKVIQTIGSTQRVQTPPPGGRTEFIESHFSCRNYFRWPWIGWRYFTPRPSCYVWTISIRRFWPWTLTLIDPSKVNC